MREKVFLMVLIGTLFFSLSVSATEKERKEQRNDIKLFQFAASLQLSQKNTFAEAEYLRFLSYYPEHRLYQTALFNLSLLYFQTKRFAESSEGFRYLSSLTTPEERLHTIALLFLAISLSREQKFDESRNLLDALSSRRLLSFSVMLPLYRDYFSAWVLLHQEKREEALKKFKLLAKTPQLTNQVKAIVNTLNRNDLQEDLSSGRAALFAALLPGSGHLYIGRKQDALVAFGLNASFLAAAVTSFMKKNIVMGLLFSFFELGWYTGNIYSAASGADKANQRSLRLQRNSLNSLDNSESLIFSEVSDYYPLLLPHDYYKTERERNAP